MIVGFLSIPVFKFVLPSIDSIGIYFERMDVLGPSFLMSMLAGYLVSKWKPDKQLEDYFEEIKGKM